MEPALSPISVSRGYPPCRTFAEISLSQLAANYRAIESTLPSGALMMPVVKANAYGHGSAPVARTLTEQGARWLAVSCVEEGVELRRAGLAGPVRIVVTAGVLPFEWSAVFEHNLTPVLHSLDEVTRMEERCRKVGRRFAFHLKVDTGLSRLGCIASAEEIARQLQASQFAFAEGFMTHFASASEPFNPQTIDQLQRFQSLISDLRDRGIRLPILHADATNSLHYPPHEGGFQLVRPGLALYGYTPRAESSLPGRLDVAPALSWRARVLLTKRIPAGSLVGYGALHRTTRPTTIAVLAVGYADGYPRSLSEAGRVLLRGASAPILGAISMDLTTVDVTDIPEASPEDAATLIGSDGPAAIDAAEIAAIAGTIPYEILTNIHNRVKRVYTP